MSLRAACTYVQTCGETHHDPIGEPLHRCDGMRQPPRGPGARFLSCRDGLSAPPHRRHMLSWILLDNAESTAVSLHGGKPFPAVIPRARTRMDLRPESSPDIPPRETRSGQTVSQPFPGTPAAAAAPASSLFAQAATPLPDIDDATFADWIDRYANARVVLLGEASHGTAEFYRARTRLTQRLIADHGFSVVAVEADWPDAAAVDRYVRHRSAPPASAGPNFARFPTWMWRNTEVAALSSGCANSMPCVRPRNAPAFRAGYLQPVGVHGGRAVLSGACGSDGRGAGAAALRVPGALAAQARALWPCRDVGGHRGVRGGGHRPVARAA